MSKYSPLSDHFASLTQDTWRPTFTDIELLLGSTLPKAARQPAWWIGEGKAHQRAWLDQGWRLDDIVADWDDSWGKAVEKYAPKA